MEEQAAYPYVLRLRGLLILLVLSRCFRLGVRLIPRAAHVHQAGPQRIGLIYGRQHCLVAPVRHPSNLQGLDLVVFWPDWPQLLLPV